MAIKHLWSDLIGTTLQYFKLGINGVRLKNNSGNLALRNNGDTADAELQASTVKISGDGFTLNSDATNSGADFAVVIQRAASGMTAPVTLTLPVDDGSPAQALMTDGSGVLYWASAGDTSANWKVDSTTLDVGASSPVSMFVLPAGAVIDKVKVIVDTAFDGTPSVTVGVAGDTARYSAAGDSDLKQVAVFETNPGAAPTGAPETLIATYAAGGATTGSARILVTFAIPT